MPKLRSIKYSVDVDRKNLMVDRLDCFFLHRVPQGMLFKTYHEREVSHMLFLTVETDRIIGLQGSIGRGLGAIAGAVTNVA